MSGNEQSSLLCFLMPPYRSTLCHTNLLSYICVPGVVDLPLVLQHNFCFSFFFPLPCSSSGQIRQNEPILCKKTTKTKPQTEAEQNMPKESNDLCITFIIKAWNTGKSHYAVLAETAQYSFPLLQHPVLTVDGKCNEDNLLGLGSLSSLMCLAFLRGCIYKAMSPERRYSIVLH